MHIDFSKLTLTALARFTGGLSKPSKMPCPGWSTPAQRCITGGIYQSIAGSVCSKCYAMIHQYVFKVGKAARERRHLLSLLPEYAPAMIETINRKRLSHFRWYDSGDVSSPSMLHKVMEIAVWTKPCQHWLPTQELQIARFVLANVAKPSNLTIRVSSVMIDQPRLLQGFPTSSVHSQTKPYGFGCPAPSQGNKCLDCRACWLGKVKNVGYHYHQ